MGKVIVSGVPGLDGEYELVVPPYTQQEWHQIKKQTGIRPLELEEAWQAGDPDVTLAFAWVSMTRAGQHPRLVWEELGKQDLFEALTFDFTDEEDAGATDADPPQEETPTSSSEREHDNVSELRSSGASTPTPSESQESAPRATGTSA